jgi:myosin-crossreactive antigen
MSILGLAYECPILQLFDFKTKKVFEFFHHRHLKPIGHDIAKLITKGFISRIKNDVINTYLAYK